jgi:hypothetical protein
MSKIQDERTKLTATFLNGISIAMVAAGGIAPLVAFSYDLPGAARGPAIAFVGIGWMAGGFALHFIARWLLRGMKE